MRARDRQAVPDCGMNVGRDPRNLAPSRLGIVTGGGYPSAMPRRYFVTTFGCQMNAHDSERIKGMLEELGLGEAAERRRRRRRRLQHLHDPREAGHEARRLPRRSRGAQATRPDRVIAVGGCYAEAQRERIFELYPEVDVAFGPGLDRPSRRVARRRRGGRRPRPLRPRRARLRRRRCRCTASGRSRPGCRSRWAATRSAPTASSRPSGAASRAARPGEIVAEVTRLAGEGVRSSRCSARTSTRGAATSRPSSRPSSASCSAPATPSRGSSASASRARIRRTSASR